MPAQSRRRLEKTPVTEMELEPADFRLIAKPLNALQAAEERANQAGLKTESLGDALEGDAQDVGRNLAEYAIEKAKGGWQGVILSGGEVTTQLGPGAKPNEGRTQSRNRFEFCLSYCRTKLKFLRCLRTQTVSTGKPKKPTPLQVPM